MSKFSKQIYCFYVIFYVTLCQQTPRNEYKGPEDRIIAGLPCKVEDYPFVVQYYRLLKNIKPRLCGGSLLTYQWAITAHHCVSDESKVLKKLIIAGTALHHYRVSDSGGVERKVIKDVGHPDYRKDMKALANNDVRLLKLESALPTNNPRIKPVKLPTEEFTSNARMAVVMGWGSQVPQPISDSTINKYPEYFKNVRPYVVTPIHETKLMCVEIPVAQQHECQRNFPPNYKVWPSHICGRPYDGKDACAGDSGGPLVADGRLIGTVSSGLGCGQNAYSIYCRVDQFYDFMRKHVDGLKVPVGKQSVDALRKKQKHAGEDSSKTVVGMRACPWLVVLFGTLVVLAK